MDVFNYIDKNKVLSREIDQLAYARDASIYRLLPEFVVRPQNEIDIKQLFLYATNNQKSITFRASGTSLSGQTVTEGIIGEIAYNWDNITVKNNGNSIVLDPGVIGAHANQALKIYNRKIGPDPASLKAARIGGIVGNNASGMTTGKPCNSYNTLMNIRFILPNGNMYDTSDENSYHLFEKQDSKLCNELIGIRNRINKNSSLQSKIIDKYRLKNTIGYSLNSFVDFKHPLDILSHLLVGSEGTLSFISNVELETVPDPKYKSTGLIVFSSIQDACNSILSMKQLGAKALELMDYASLKTAKYMNNAPYDIDILQHNSFALLCEFQEDDKFVITDNENNINSVISNFNGKLIGNFVQNENERLKLWSVRKNLFTTIGALRKPGTSVITEDICVDIENLGEAIADLHRIFMKWSYDDAVVFGHAKDGNIHFNLSIDLESKRGIASYHKMMEEVVDITLNRYNGSLKAEHGTGRNMASFVKDEWGEELFEIMQSIKKAVDPKNILNPGVIFNDRKNIHIENLKQMPNVHSTIDLCVECGFCEPVCPSRGFTLTPRQRIGVSRELIFYNKNESDISRKLNIDSTFSIESTCAVDGMCETVCPVNINTGEYVKELRKSNSNKFSNIFALWISNHFKLTTISIRFLIKIMSINTKYFSFRIVKDIIRWLNNSSNHRIPSWNEYITGSSKSIPIKEYGVGDKYIYYPSCISRTFNANGQNESIIEIIVEIATQTNVMLIIPDKIEDTCCGTPFSSKGFSASGLNIFEKTVDVLYESTQEGKYPIVVDTSPCSYKFLHPQEDLSSETKNKWEKLRFIDIIPFLYNMVQHNNKKPLNRNIVLHPTCSSREMGDVKILKLLSEKCALKITIPENSSCCGFAGDRGLLIPKLSMNAVTLNKKALNINERKYTGYSSSRMCEIGMSDQNQKYSAIALLVRDYLNQK